MENIVEVKVQKAVETLRPELIVTGSLFGKRIFKVEERPGILNFHETLDKARDLGDIFLSRNIKRYNVIPVDITGVNVDTAIDGSVEIVLNKGRVNSKGESAEIHCKISKEKFTKDVSAETIMKALTEAAGGKYTYFSAGKKLADIINHENEKERNRLVELKSTIDSLINVMDETIKKNIEEANVAYKALDKLKSMSLDTEETVEITL